VTFATLPWRAILVGSLIGPAAALADVYDVSGFLAHNELKAVNAQFSLGGPRTPHAPVVIVTIDQDSFVELKRPWPRPRALHAKFLDIVSRGEPAVIALDILFIEPSSRGPAGHLPARRLLARRQRGDPPEAFEGKIVLVGATAQILQDVFPTPFAPFRTMPGVMIHANILDTLFASIPIRRAPAWVDAALAMVAGGAAGWAATAFRPLAAFFLVAGTALTYLAGKQVAFRWERLWMDALPVPLALFVPYMGVAAENFAQEQLEKRWLSRFFSPSVVKEIVRQKDDAGLGAGRRRMTVLFSGIRGFTSMLDRMQPEEVVPFLRESLTVMTEVVFRHGGAADKYIGNTINRGSRLESITKDFNVPIVISEATWLEVNGLFETRYLGEVTVKGKEIPAKIYTVVDPPPV